MGFKNVPGSTDGEAKGGSFDGELGDSTTSFATGNVTVPAGGYQSVPGSTDGEAKGGSFDRELGGSTVPTAAGGAFITGDDKHTRGPEGPPGPPGIEGPMGQMGSTGPRGEQGIQGQMGEQGYQGIGIGRVEDIDTGTETVVTIVFDNPEPNGVTPMDFTFRVPHGQSGPSVGDTYTLSYNATTQKIILTDSSGGTSEVDAGATEIGFLPFGHDDHSGATNEGEIIIGRGGQTIYRMVVGLEETDTIPTGGDNSLIDKNSDGGELIFQLSSMVQAGDKRPPTSEAVHNALSTIPVSGDLVTFEDLTLDTPVEFRLDEIEYNTQQDGHIHDILFKFENDEGQIGQKGIQTQAPISDGRPATVINMNDGSDPERYVTVARAREWAQNEFLEDSQRLLSSDPLAPATVEGISEIPTADWLNNTWRPFYLPAGTKPDNWSDFGPGDHIQVTGSGDNVVGMTVNASGHLTDIVRGTIEPGTNIEVYSSTKEYSLGDTVYTLNSGAAHVYIYINATATTGMDPEDQANNTHWDTLGVDEITAIQNDDGSLVEIHLARADNIITNPNAGMAVEVQNDEIGHSDLLNWEATNGTLILNVDGLVDDLATRVKTVNGVSPDADGDVEITTSEDIDILQLETVFSFTDAILGHNLVGYVVNTHHGSATVTSILDGVYTLSDDILLDDQYHVVSWSNSYAIILASSTSMFTIVEEHLQTGDSELAVNDTIETIELVNVHRQELPADNTAAIEAETANRITADANEEIARETGDELEREYWTAQLTREAIPSQSYYEASGVPAIFTEDDIAGDVFSEAATTVAFPPSLDRLVSLRQAEDLGFVPNKTFALDLRFISDSATNGALPFIVATGSNGSFMVTDGGQTRTYRIPDFQTTYSATSVTQNVNSFLHTTSFLYIGGDDGRFVQIPMSTLFANINVDAHLSASRTLTSSEYTLRRYEYAPYNDITAIKAYNNTVAGDDNNFIGVNLYVGTSRGEMVRYRTGVSGTIFDINTSVGEEDYNEMDLRVANTGSQQQVPGRGWNGIEIFDIKTNIQALSADGETERLSFAPGDQMLVFYGKSSHSASAGTSVPAIGIAKNHFAEEPGSNGFNLRMPGGNDPSEDYANYEGDSSDPGFNEYSFNADITSVTYHDESGTGSYRFFFGGITDGTSDPLQQAAGFHGHSPWNMSTMADNVKALIGGPIREVTTGGLSTGENGDADKRYWISTNNNTLWIVDEPLVLGQYSDTNRFQPHSDPNDPTSPADTSNVLTGFRYRNEAGSLGIGGDGHLYRLNLRPVVTVQITSGGVSYSSNYTWIPDTSDVEAMRDHFTTGTNYTPNLPDEITIDNTVPSEDVDSNADLWYLDISNETGNVPVINISHTGVLFTDDARFGELRFNPWRITTDFATTVIVSFPDSGISITTQISTAESDYVDVTPAQGALDQIAANINAHANAGVSAQRLDASFASAIVPTRPVLRINQQGVHTIENRPVIVVTHSPHDEDGTLNFIDYANNGYNTIGQASGLFDPNEYNTARQTDAKLASILGGIGEAIVIPNEGEEDQFYPDLNTIGINGTIYSTDNHAHKFEEFDSTELQFVDTGDTLAAGTAYDSPTNRTIFFALGGNHTFQIGQVLSFANSGTNFHTIVGLATSSLGNPEIAVSGDIRNQIIAGLSIYQVNTLIPRLEAVRAWRKGDIALVDNVDVYYYIGADLNTPSTTQDSDWLLSEAPVPFDKPPTGSPGVGKVLKASDAPGTQLEWADDIDTDAVLRATPGTAVDESADDAWNGFVGTRLGFTKASIAYAETITPTQLGFWAPAAITTLTNGLVTITNIPSGITLVDATRYTLTIASGTGYNGMIAFSGSDVTAQSTGGSTGITWDVNTSDDGVIATPAVSTTAATLSSTGNSVVLNLEAVSGDSVQTSGQVTLTGPGVSYDAETDAFTFEGGGSGQDVNEVQALITGRLNDGTGTSENTDQAYTVTEANRLIGLKADTASAVIDGDIRFNAANEIVAIEVGNVRREIAAASGTTEIGFNLISGDLETIVDFVPVIVRYGAGQVLSLFGVPGGITLEDGVTYNANVALGDTYTGVITFTSDQATGGTTLAIEMADATSVPQFPLNTATGLIGGVHAVEVTTGTEIITFDGHSGDIVFQGTGVDRSDDGQTFTFNAIVDAVSLEAFFAADSDTGRGVSYSINDDGLIATTVAADTTKQDTINAGNAEAIRTTLNVVPGAHTHLGSSVTADQFVTVSSLPTPYGLTGTTFYITNVPIGVNAASNYRVEVSDDDVYTGVATFTGAAVTITAGNWLIDSTHSSFTATPALPTEDFVATTNQMVVIQEEQSVTTFTGVAGNINLVGDGVSRDGQTFTFSGGGVTNPFKYALLLTNGFLMEESTDMSTATRDAYRDITGAYGEADAYYWFDNTTDSWYDLQTGGVALVSFPT